MSGEAHRATLTDQQFGQGHAEHSEEALRAEAAAGECATGCFSLSLVNKVPTPDLGVSVSDALCSSSGPWLWG